MAEFWTHLVNTALLGTDKKTVDTNLLPEPLREKAGQISAADRESQLLKIAALSVCYLKAGTGPEKLSVPVPATSEPETQPYAPAKAQNLLKKLIHKEGEKGALVELWLDKCIDRNWIISPELLVPVLTLGKEKPLRHLQPKIAKVVGKRGQWMGQFKKDWQYISEADYLRIWDEGKAVERKEAFGHLRAQGPDQARDLLQKSWATESAKDKSDFLDILEINLSSADETLLNQIFEELEQAKDKQKPANIEIRKKVVRLLLRLPESQLSKEIWEKVKRYFHPQSEQQLMQLPAQEDDFFNQANMTERLAFSDDSFNNYLYNNIINWMYEIISFIPPKCWVELFECTPEKILERWFFGVHHNNKQANALAHFTKSLAMAATLHKDKEWVIACVAFFKERKTMLNDVAYLFNYLPQPKLEEYYKQLEGEEWKDTIKTDLRELMINTRLGQWSLDFTVFMMKDLSKRLRDTYMMNEHRKFIEKAIRFIHPDVVPLLSTLPDQDIAEWQKQQWEMQIVSPLTQLLEIRLEIENL